MGVYFETGYTLPSGDEPTTHARILHKGNRLRMKSILASSTSKLSASVLDRSTTFERWKPFANSVVSPTSFSATNWTATGVTLGTDGQTLSETAATSEHKISSAVTYTAVEWVVSARVNRQTAPEVQLVATDGGTNSAFFDLRDGTVGTQSGATGEIFDLGDDEFLLKMYWTALAATGTIELKLSNGSETVSYLGATTETVRVLEITAHPSVATVDFTPFTALEADLFCLAAHNIGASGGRITLEHGSGHTGIMGTTINPTDNEPIMAIFAPITPTEWRLTIDRAVLPEAGVVRWGKALQMTRPLFGGHEQLAMARQTVMRSNKSTTGEWLGQTKLRTGLATGFDWDNIESDWVRANWPQFQKAAEDEAFFMAWRPATYPDAAYCSISKHSKPVLTGTRNLMSLSLSVTGFLNV